MVDFAGLYGSAEWKNSALADESDSADAPALAYFGAYSWSILDLFSKLAIISAVVGVVALLRYHRHQPTRDQAYEKSVD